MPSNPCVRAVHVWVSAHTVTITITITIRSMGCHCDGGLARAWSDCHQNRSGSVPLIVHRHNWRLAQHTVSGWHSQWLPPSGCGDDWKIQNGEKRATHHSIFFSSSWDCQCLYPSLWALWGSLMANLMNLVSREQSILRQWSVSLYDASAAAISEVPPTARGADFVCHFSTSFRLIPTYLTSIRYEKSSIVGWQQIDKVLAVSCFLKKICFTSVLKGGGKWSYGCFCQFPLVKGTGAPVQRRSRLDSAVQWCHTSSSWQAASQHLSVQKAVAVLWFALVKSWQTVSLEVKAGGSWYCLHPYRKDILYFGSPSTKVPCYYRISNNMVQSPVEVDPTIASPSSPAQTSSPWLWRQRNWRYLPESAWKFIHALTGSKLR